jgi:hypothetical protein
MKHAIEVAPGVVIATNRDDVDISGWADALRPAAPGDGVPDLEEDGERRRWEGP